MWLCHVRAFAVAPERPVAVVAENPVPLWQALLLEPETEVDAVVSGEGSSVRCASAIDMIDSKEGFSPLTAALAGFAVMSQHLHAYIDSQCIAPPVNVRTVSCDPVLRGLSVKLLLGLWEVISIRLPVSASLGAIPVALSVQALRLSAFFVGVQKRVSLPVAVLHC